MTTEIANASTTALVDADEFLSRQAAALQRNLKSTGKTLSIGRNGRFKLPTGEEVDELSVVIIDMKYRNQYFDKPFSQGAYTPPACWALGEGNAEPAAPDASVAEPQALSCPECPMNAFSSRGKGKACQNQILLAVMMPDTAESDEVFTVKCAPTAIKEVSNYIQRIISAHGHPIKVITTLTSDPKVDYPKILPKFEALNTLYKTHLSYFDEAARVLGAKPELPVAEPNPELSNAAKAKLADRANA